MIADFCVRTTPQRKAGLECQVRGREERGALGERLSKDLGIFDWILHGNRENGLPLRQFVFEFGFEKVPALIQEFPRKIHALTLDEVLSHLD
jgi:hypothetical protein